MYDFIYGSRAKIGLIYPAPGCVMEPEFYFMSPKGVVTLTTRLKLDTANIDITEKSIEAAKLLAEASVDVIVLGCLSTGFLNGLKYEDNLLQDIEFKTGIKCISTSKSVIKALNTLEVSQVSILTSYTEELNKKVISYMKENDISVTRLKGLNLNTDREINALDLETVYRSVKSIDDEESRAIVVFCTALRTVPIIKMLERDLNKPVITAIQATFWNCLGVSSINDNMSDFGSLFLV